MLLVSISTAGTVFWVVLKCPQLLPGKGGAPVFPFYPALALGGFSATNPLPRPLNHWIKDRQTDGQTDTQR